MNPSKTFDDLLMEVLDKNKVVDVPSLLCLTDAITVAGHGDSRLMDVFVKKDLIEAFCKKNELIFVYSHQNHMICIPLKYLFLESFSIGVSPAMEFEAKHIIGAHGKNIRHIVEMINHCKRYLPADSYNGYHGLVGSNWLAQKYGNKNPFIKETKRINVTIKQ